MAAQGGTSRLAQMQMRFQQKQQEEREQRKIEMTVPFKSRLESGDSKSLNTTIGTGKVRQMFDERRRGTGIDKSLPLKPITGRTQSGPTVTTKTTATTIRKQVASVKQVNGRISSSKSEIRETAVRTLNGKGNSTSDHIFSHDSIENEEMPDMHRDIDNDFNGNVPTLNVLDIGKLSLSNDNEIEKSDTMGDRNNNSSDLLKLKPVVTKKTAPLLGPSAGRITPRSKAQSTVSKSSPTTSKAKTNVKSPPSSASSGKSIAARSKKMATAPVKASTRSVAGPIPENMVACKICGRHFNKDRIEKHQQICEKTATKKRKTFDAAKHRVKGTEVEPYIRKNTKSTMRSGALKLVVSSNATAEKKNDWRRKHEEFIQAIRAAKEMQAHLARGGKVSDLPPPPPSENPDYVECPHCHRRFNQGAASRHIPKCATMLHNKPKPGVKSVNKR